MLVLQTALACEAKPWIEAFSLQSIKGHGSLRVYQTNGLSLVISGTGMQRACASLSFLLGRLSMSDDCDTSQIRTLNIGVAGCADQNVAIGSCHLIGKCSYPPSGRDLYADTFFQHPLPIATLCTSDEVVRKLPTSAESFSKETLLWDMEGYGFFVAASLFLPPSAMQSIKIVIDHLQDAGQVRASAVEGMIRNQMKTLLPIIDLYRSAEVSVPKERALSKADKEWVEQCALQLFLTSTQKEQLLQTLRWRKLNGNNSNLPAIPRGITNDKKIHKRDQKKAFAHLLNDLGPTAAKSELPENV